MFTGIIEQRGTVIAVEPAPHGRVLRVRASGWPPDRRPGESIAVNGVCLTLVDDDEPGSLRFDVIPQTLDVTTLGGLAAGDAVNLERAVTPQTLLGGHVVQGHVDDVGQVVGIETTEGEHRIAVAPPTPLLPYVVVKGSIAIEGVSLTVATLSEDRFEVALIPTTLALTNLGTLRVGSRVNLETDYVVKAVVRYLETVDLRLGT